MRGGPNWKASLSSALIVTSLLGLILGAAARLDRHGQGLKARYFANTTWASPVVVSQTERQPSTLHLVEAWGGSPPTAFSVTWTGSIVALREGTYTLATVSDGGSLVFVDGRLVVDNGGRHSAQLATGSIHLARGAHSLFITYFQDGGPLALSFLWSRNDAPLEPVPAWALRSGVPSSFTRLLASLLVDRSLAGLEWLWTGVVLVAGAALLWRWVVRFSRFLARTCAWPALAWILAGSLVLNLVGIWWGLPVNWAQAEVTPTLVFGAISQHFSHGWFDTYPPFHFYVLTAAISPVLLLEYWGRVDVSGAIAGTVLVVIFRLVSVAASLGTVVAACLCGTQAFGRRAGLFAAASLALVAPFIYYSKTANVDVPYLFWCALSLVFYLRLLDRLRLRDFVLFAASATLAVCTKDQAYGLYLAAPLVVVHRIWSVNRQAGCVRPFLRALFDRRLAAAATTAAALFAVCHNLLFNLNGFLDHVRYLTGPGSQDYRVFEPTAAGRVELLQLTGHLIEESLGWPMLLVVVTGLVVAVATPCLRRTSAWLLIPVVSYYVGFINVILYNYDRFVLPICLVLALFGGLALDFVLTGSRARRWRIAGVVGVLTYTVLYSGTVDMLMLADSRYAVEGWMRTHASLDDLVGVSGPVELLPRLGDFRLADIATVTDLQRQRPVYFVLNADYARAVSPDTSWGQLIAGLQDGTLGYRLARRFRHSSPWPWLPGSHPDLVGQRLETVVFSMLRDINPTIEVFQRDSAGRR